MDIVTRTSKAITHFIYYLKMVDKTHPVVAKELVRLPIKYLILPMEAKLGVSLTAQRTLLQLAFKDPYNEAVEKETAASQLDCMLFGGAFTTLMERLNFELEYMNEYHNTKGGFMTSQSVISHLGASLMTLTNHETILGGLESVHENAGVGDIPAYITAAYYDYYSDPHWFGPDSEAWHDQSGVYTDEATA
jgi:hypothetical protein